MPDETVLDIPIAGEGEAKMAVENLTDPGNLGAAMTVLANGIARGANRQADAADQLSNDSQRMWTIAMTTPTQLSALGYRTAIESGSGRTRAETNYPAETSAATKTP
jgi:hypothetical protein